MSTPKPNSTWVLRVSIEGVVIVMSILLALAADAWWQDRQEREEEAELLAGLRMEFLGIEQDLLRYQGYYEFVTSDIEALLAIDGQAPRAMRPAQTDSAFNSLTFAPSYQPGEATLEGLVASGRLEQLRSPALRDALNTWRHSLDEISDGQTAAQDYVRSTLIPYLARVGMPMLRVYPAMRSLPPSAAGLAGFDSLESEADVAAIYDRVRRDAEFRALAGWRLREVRGSTVEVAEAMQVAQHVLQLLAG